MQVFINTYGSYLHVKEEMFEIRQRDTPGEKVKKNHLAAHKVSSFIISKGTAVSSDAIALALKHNIDIVLVENDGHPIGRFWHSKLGSTTLIRKLQLQASMDKTGLFWIKQWITEKLENQETYLLDLKKHRKSLGAFLLEKAEGIRGLREKIEKTESDNVTSVSDSIRGWEGSAGRMYFEGLSKSIPEAFRFSGRSYRPAEDPFNAMLNYAYGILYSRVERVLIIAGLDPYLGFLHRDDYNMKSLVFDFIEPYRIHAERCVFGLFSTKKVTKSFFNEITGGISLNSEGKPFLVEKFMEYMDQQKIRHRNRNQTRFNAMQLESHAFANELIKMDKQG